MQATRRGVLTAAAAAAAATVLPASAQQAPIRIGSTLALTGPLSQTALTTSWSARSTSSS